MVRRTFALVFLVTGLLAMPPAAEAQSRTDSSSSASLPTGEFVRLRSDTTITGAVTLKTQTFGPDSLVLNDSVRYKRDRATAYRVDSTTYRRGPDEEWVRLAESGPIDRWTKTEWRAGMTVVHQPNGQVRHTMGPPTRIEAEYFSVDGGVIQEVEPDALRPVVKDVPESRRYVNQYQTLGRVQLGLGLAGLAVLVGSLATYDKGGDVPTGVYLGGGIAATSWIPHLARQSKLDQAIRVYNREKRPASASGPSEEAGAGSP